jgi:prepilin-type processing-associated H-X9-DG protein
LNCPTLAGEWQTPYDGYGEWRLMFTQNAYMGNYHHSVVDGLNHHARRGIRVKTPSEKAFLFDGNQIIQADVYGHAHSGGVITTTIAAPNTTPAAPSFSHNGKANFLFKDGHGEGKKSSEVTNPINFYCN